MIEIPLPIIIILGLPITVGLGVMLFLIGAGIAQLCGVDVYKLMNGDDNETEKPTPN